MNTLMPVTPFGLWLSNLRNSLEDSSSGNPSFRLLELVDLGVDGVQSLISGIMGPTQTGIKQLALTIHKKTMGNPYFIQEFLQNMITSGILSYNVNMVQWMWDDKKVETVEVTDNVAGMLRGKLGRLDSFSHFLVQVAACIGSTFDMFSLLMGANSLQDQASLLGVVSMETISKSMQTLLGEGIVERRGFNEEAVHFAHDQIQKAAMDMLSPTKQRLWQSTIGQSILDQSEEEEIEKRLFVITDLMNKGISNFAIDTLDRREELLDLNYRAGKKSISTSAYAAATSYLKTAIKLLSDSRWDHDQRARTLDLYSTAAESEYCNAKFDSMQKLINVVIEADIPYECKLRSHVILVCFHETRGNFREAITIGSRVLNLIHGKTVIPSKASTSQVIFELLKTKRVMRRQSFDDLSNLPLLDDETKAYADRLHDILLTAAYTARPDLFPLLPLKGVRSCVKYGVGSYSPAAFAAFAVILCWTKKLSCNKIPIWTT